MMVLPCREERGGGKRPPGVWPELLGKHWCCREMGGSWVGNIGGSILDVFEYL